MNKWIYYFGTKGGDGNAQMKDVLGSKGAGLAEMSNLSLPIPDGFTITTELCNYFYKNNYSLPENFNNDLVIAIKNLENSTGKVFGDHNNPLLLSVRSGSRASMPGMMDTILNLGYNDQVCDALSNITGNEIFALDSYRRFLEMYGSMVLSISNGLFKNAFEIHKVKCNIYQDKEITGDFLRIIVEEFKKIIFNHGEESHGKESLFDPYKQLEQSIKAVLKSWAGDRAVTYRKLHNIPNNWGTAINVQSMVFGNQGSNSATGVVFSRCPATGENKLFGEYLINAQGEDVVSGTRTPSPITNEHDVDCSMQIVMPQIFEQLQEICKKLELHYLDVQDIEFTVQNGVLYILQTRTAKRTALASIKIATDMVQEGLISKQQAIMRIESESLTQLLHTAIDYSNTLDHISKGLPASPGAATGIVVFSPYDAEKMLHHHKVILVRHDTSPEDINGMYVSAGILTARGGMTSHAAVVARGLGKPCVCGANDLVIDEKKQIFKIGNTIINYGDLITIDGGTGKIFLGEVQLTQPTFTKEFQTILDWADEFATLKVRANAETILDAGVSLKFGASGIGLCRTEHMFFDHDKIPLVREMIIAPDLERRKHAISKLLPLQIQDFKALFKIIQGKPINIRLLDPPLHEFLPTTEDDKRNLAKVMNLPLAVVEQRLNALYEVNPMLGHRGCRLGISYPEIYQMQIRAIFTAIRELQVEENINTILELMIPLISDVNELKILKIHIQDVITNMEDINKCKFDFTLGTMIELPRAALKAGEIAEELDYFSFGTNDLTQTTYGISRDDVASFFPDYLEKKIFAFDPFSKLDEEGVGELIKIAIKRGLKSNPTLKLGVCGEHAGNPHSIEFFYRVGLHYVSCSPYRIPIARIAAAQATIKADGYQS
ncbi:pyruvate, phosphate dikinase [Candidatus Tisiphia endosymbiont of Mystacides longicornis]|uniref:pyruvate, phosphate dikinase n=1 Tax=Candidatus Tisiphia endosymbiont of Mystacides longicornis TaxID=3139330 RepID=UPI003CCAF61A